MPQDRDRHQQESFGPHRPLTVRPYDHANKAGNQGDVVKHPALVAALRGLLAEQSGMFRYADTFAGRWDYDLSRSGGWRQGIGVFASAWRGRNPDIQFWRNQWSVDPITRYPGSTKLAKRILSNHGDHEIRAFEIMGDYAADLRGGLSKDAVFSRSANTADWANWKPDLLFIDPPGPSSGENPGYPSLGSLLSSAASIENVLMWLPMTADTGTRGSAAPLDSGTVLTLAECARSGLRVLAVRWDNRGPFCGCLLAYRFASGAVVTRVGAAVREVVRTMGGVWRVL